MTIEEQRLEAARAGSATWRRWGPYLSERQWGTVREDYSAAGAAWEYCSHEDARSKAYRWGEDGIAGICDDRQQLCFALAMWNGVDSILKERMFGLTGGEGNHGEDVKEYYFYLDNIPSSPFRTRTWSRRTAAAAAASRNMSCSTPGSSMTIATSTCSSNTPRTRRRTI